MKHSDSGLLRWLLWGSMVLWSFCVLPAQALVIKGEGLGDSEAEARQQALADIASQIEISVESSTQGQRTYQSGEESKSSVKILTAVETHTDLPLLGVSYGKAEKGKLTGLYRVVALLEPFKALPLYKDALDSRIRNLKTLQTQAAQARGKPTEVGVLETLLAEGLQLEKYRLVMLALGSQEALANPVDLAEVRWRLGQLADTIDTLDKAATVLAKGIRQTGIMVYPPRAPGSTEVTPFGAALDAALEGRVKAVDRIEAARFHYRGDYQILEDGGIEVHYRLLEAGGNIALTRTVRLLPAALDGLEFQPRTVGIEQLIKDGQVLTRDFRLEVNTNLGRQDLLFRQGETLKIMVKMNRPGWFYAIEHVHTEAGDSSMLLELEPAADVEARRFIYRVGADEVNTWIVLGEFEVTPPFGIERLQFIASTTDLAGRLPAYHWDRKLQQYILGFDTGSAISQTRTRGLKIKTGTPAQGAGAGTPGDANTDTESFLTFTTME